MKNIYINKFKAIVTDYYTEVCSLRSKAKYNSVTFTPTLAQDYNAEVEQEITNQANKSIEEINSVFKELKAKSQFGILSVAKISVLMLLFLKVALLIRKSLIFFYKNIIMIMLLCQFADLFRLIPNSQNRQALSKRQAIMFQLIVILQSVRSSWFSQFRKIRDFQRSNWTLMLMKIFQAICIALSEQAHPCRRYLSIPKMNLWVILLIALLLKCRQIRLHSLSKVFDNAKMLKISF